MPLTTNAMAKSLIDAAGVDLSDGQDEINAAVRDAVRHLENVDNALRSCGERIERTMRELKRNLDDGSTVNSCGVLQSDGRDMDRLAGERDIRINHLTQMLFLKKRLSGTA